MRRLFVVGLMLLCATMFVAAPLYSQETFSDQNEANQPSGEAMLWDILVMRPAGLVTCVLGIGATIVALPFAAPSGSASKVADTLIGEPFAYTFGRPIGHFDPAEPR